MRKRAAPLGYLVGEPNRGLEYMFIMMNAARFSVGVQGLAIADRAYQSALAYAKERVQSRDIKTSLHVEHKRLRFSTIQTCVAC